MPWYLIYDAAGAVNQSGFADDASIASIGQFIAASDLPGVVDPKILAIPELPLPPERMTDLTYVDNGVLRSRVPIAASVSATTIAADGVAEADITGLPTPSCFCTISGAVTVARFEITDGTLEVTSNVVGDILVSITAPPPWLAWSITISAA